MPEKRKLLKLLDCVADFGVSKKSYNHPIPEETYKCLEEKVDISKLKVNLYI